MERVPALPNLVVAGEMKCGTTSLHEYLARHPSIQMSDPKEVNYFGGFNAHRSLDWYMSLFDATYPVRGEASQNYTKRHHPTFASSLERMAATIPQAKVVYLVRDPVERYKSHLSYNYYMVWKNRNAWARETDHYFKTGLYHYQLEEVLKYYAHEQVMVVDSDNLRRDRHPTMNRIFAFLGVDAVPDDGRFDFQSNEHGEERVPIHVRANPLVRLAARVAPGPTRRVLGSRTAQNAFLKHGGTKTLPQSEEARLREAYAPDVAKLRALTGQRFAGWSV